MQPLPLKQIHPLWLRCCHWINAVTVAGMICSGWRIYNASPLFSFNYPAALTLGGWLGGALLWHFALMWILLINATIYLTLGICSGRFRSKFFPLSWTSLKKSLYAGTVWKAASYEYAGIQYGAKVAYILIILDGAALLLSGLVLWKPVQFSLLTILFGGYDTARYIHFLCMSIMVLFIIIHRLWCYWFRVHCYL